MSEKNSAYRLAEKKKENIGVGSGRLVGLRREKKLKQGRQGMGKKKKCVLKENVRKQVG